MSNEVAPQHPNPFEAFGNAATRSAHPLLKFSKGDYLFGQDSEEMPMGTELVAVMDEFRTGMIKWTEGAPSERLMGLVGDGFVPPRRAELGDTDKEAWEKDDRGDPKDPWQLSNELPMVMREDTGNVFLFVTSSRGGLSALGELCKAYGRRMRTHPDEYPVIRLDFGSYMHPNKNFGRIKFPKFEIVAWTNKEPWDEAAGGDAPEAAAAAVATPEAPAIEHERQERVARAARTAASQRDPNSTVADDVPF